MVKEEEYVHKLKDTNWKLNQLKKPKASENN